LTQAGVRGPVELVGYHDDEIIIKDLSSHKWSYKVGLEGLRQNLYSSDSSKWQQDNYPTNKMFTWYKVNLNPNDLLITCSFMHAHMYICFLFLFL
jgi:hypothetical protein